MAAATSLVGTQIVLIEVTDLGAEAHYHQRRKGALRVTLSTLANALRSRHDFHNAAIVTAVWPQIATVIADADDDVDGEVIRASLAAIDGLPNAWQRLLAGMKGRDPSVQFYDDNNRVAGFILYASRPLERGFLDESNESADSGADAVTDRDEFSAHWRRCEALRSPRQCRGEGAELRSRCGSN